MTTTTINTTIPALAPSPAVNRAISSGAGAPSTGDALRRRGLLTGRRQPAPESHYLLSSDQKRIVKFTPSGDTVKVITMAVSPGGAFLEGLRSTVHESMNLEQARDHYRRLLRTGYKA